MKIRTIILAVLLIVPLSIFAASKMQIEIFTDSAHPVNVAGINDAQINYYNLDAAQKIMNQFKARMQGVTKENAPQIAKGLFLKNKNQLKQAYLGLFIASQYGLQKYPAIVFNGKAVVFGETNLSQSISEYKKWQK